MKTHCSRWLRRTRGFPGFEWQTGDGAFSVSRSLAPSVVRYILEPEKHHRRVTFQEEFVAFLKRNGIPYNVFGVEGAVGVGAGAAVLVLRYLVLIDHPFERAAIAQAIFKGFGRDAAERPAEELYIGIGKCPFVDGLPSSSPSLCKEGARGWSEISNHRALSPLLFTLARNCRPWVEAFAGGVS